MPPTKTARFILPSVFLAVSLLTYLYDHVQKQECKFATILSNLFSPLFFITVAAYLIAMIIEGRKPYTNRDFLITLNGLLIVIWAVTVFSIAGKPTKSSTTAMDYVNIGLLAVTLLVNALALSAIVFRWFEYGVTPNKVVVTGANIIIFVHLGLILARYANYIRHQVDTSRLHATITGYLPVYTVWSVIVVFVLPVIFQYG